MSGANIEQVITMKEVPQESKFSNPVLDNIYARRSVRKFTDDIVPEDIIGEILRAGCYAPSGCNCQPWRFVVINNSAMVKRLGKRVGQLLVKYEKPPSTAPACGVWADLAQDPEMDFFYGAPPAGARLPKQGWTLSSKELLGGSGEHDAGGRLSRIGKLLGRGWTYLVP